MKYGKKIKIAFNNAGYLEKKEDISNIVTNLSTSTNNIIINELIERGFNEIYQFNSPAMRLDGNETALAHAVKLKLYKKSNKKDIPGLKPLKFGDSACSYSGSFQMNLNEFDIIFIRGDDIEANPDIINIYEKAKKPLCINSPEGTLATKDKFEIKKRAEKAGLEIPLTLNITDYQEMLYALKEIPGKYKVIKERYGFGGKEVWRVTKETPEEELKKIFSKCYRGLIVQEYKEIVKNGDLRLNVFEGEVLGNKAILRQARNGMWKTNIDLGGLYRPYEIDERIKNIARKVSEAYPEVRLSGVDLLLDGTFIETNTYPTTIGYLYEFCGFKFEDIFLDKIFKEIKKEKKGSS